MKKVIAIVASLSFCVALSANDVKVSKWDQAKEKTTQACSKVKETIKNNKYAKYGLIGAGAAVGVIGLYYGGNKLLKNK